jgi:phage tail sheath protein FI
VERADDDEEPEDTVAWAAGLRALIAAEQGVLAVHSAVAVGGVLLD